LLLIIYQEAEENKLPFFVIVHQSPRPENPNLKPQLIYNEFSSCYADGFVKDGLLQNFCDLVQPEACISEDNAAMLLKRMRKTRATPYNNFVRQEANGKLSNF
jgi:hypothetical protein